MHNFLIKSVKLTKPYLLIRLFFWQLEKAREATDEANLRSAYAEVVNAALTEEGKDDSSVTDKTSAVVKKTSSGVSTYSIEVKAQQTSSTNDTDGWANGKPTIGDVKDVAVTTASGKNWVVSYTEGASVATITVKQ